MVLIILIPRTIVTVLVWYSGNTSDSINIVSYSMPS